MFELPSARTFIAGGNEFLFARFYDVYEGVQLVQSDANIQLVEMLTFFSNEYSICISNGNLHMCFL